MEKITWLKDTPDSSAFEKSAQFWDHLSEHAYPLTKGAMRIPISLEPFILTKKEYDNLHSQVTLLISAAKKLAEAFYHDPLLEEILAIDPQELQLIRQSKEDPLIGIVRVDLFQGEEPKVVEINADFPDGFFMHDVTSAAIKSLAGDNLATSSNTKLFIELLEAQDVKKDDHIFIGYNGERKFIDEFELTRLKLEEAGWKNISVGAFEDLEFIDGMFYFDKKRVDVIRRGAELSKLREMPDLIQQLIEARKSGLKIVNNFKMRLLGHKSLLAALHHPEFAHYFSRDELSAISSLLPKTLKFHEANINDLLIEKDRWVLKPSDLAEGSGVTIGSNADPKEWEEVLATASVNPQKWVLQEKISIPSQVFTLVDHEQKSKTEREAYFDMDPHIILFENHSKVGNILVRFSESEILNVMRGGGITYAFYEND